jgi:hypothetical protein
MHKLWLEQMIKPVICLIILNLRISTDEGYTAWETKEAMYV